MNHPRLRFALPVAIGLGFIVLLFGLARRPGSTPPLPESHPPEVAQMPVARSAPEAVAQGETPALRAVTLARRAVVPATPDHTAFERFDRWSMHYLAARADARPALVADGLAFAAERRMALAALIPDDPRQALEKAVPMVVRQQLPAEIVAQLEERVSTEAFFGVLGVAPLPDAPPPLRPIVHEVRLDSGKRYEAFVYGRRATQRTTERAKITGIALDAAMAVDERPLRVLEAGEIPQPAKGLVETCPISGKSTIVARTEGALPPITQETPAVEIAAEVHYLCDGGHIRLIEERLVAGEGASGGPTEPTGTIPGSWTSGPRTLLYMRVCFPETRREPQTETAAYDMMRQVNDFFVENSYGTIYLLSTITPLIVLPHSESWYVSGGGSEYYLRTHAQNVAREMGYDTNSYDLDIVVYSGGPGSFGGLGYVGGKGSWLKSINVGVAAHELGHNFGVWHANFWNTSGASTIGAGSNTEYGDIFDTMGSASAGDRHFNANFKTQLNWLPRQNYVQPITASGAYRIFAFDQPRLDPARRYAFRVTKDSTREYWAEFRQKSFSGNAWIRDGILLNWDPWPGSNSGSQLLDATPGSPDDRTDAALTIGRTFSDFDSGIHITPVGKGGTVPESMDVVVNVGAFPGNAAPTASVGASATAIGTGLNVTFTATASDADFDSLSYAWDFGDKSFSNTNSPAVVKSWSTAGDYVVRCVVSDMKGGTASDSVIVTVGTPGTFRIGGRITYSGVPLANVRVHNGLTTTSYRGTFTDSDGFYTITGLTAGSYTVGAALHGWTFARTGSTNPVTVGPDAVNANFTANLAGKVTLTLTDGTATEGADGATLTLTRTGSTSAALAVNFFNPTGTASRGSDYALAPDLLSGGTYYTATIPAGQATLDLVLTPTDDTTAEGPETATFEVAPGTGYVIGGAASVTAIIQDNDSALNVVSLRVTDVDASETGDTAAWSIERAGDTTAPLTVRYAISGTATSGADFASLGTQVVILAGETFAPVVLTPQNDALVEGAETVILTISTNAAYLRTPSSANYAGTVNLLDDDIPTLTVVAADPTAGENGSDPGTFLITRSGDLTQLLTVQYALGGSGHHGVDYTPVPGVLTIPAGSAIGSVTIAPLDDALGEPQQTAILQLRGSLTYVVGNPGIATINLTDNSDLPIVTVGVTDGVAVEPADVGTFRITTTGTGTGNITVRYLVTGSAVADADYSLAGLEVGTGIATVSMGRNTTATITVTPLDDSAIEGYESVIVTLLPDAAYATHLDTTARINLADDDAPVVNASRTDQTVSETSTAGNFWISRTGATTDPLDVNYTVSGTATPGDDYALLSGTITIPAAASGVTLTFTPINDTLAEGAETVTIDLAPGAYGLGLASATQVLADNDALPVTVRFDSATGSGPEDVGTVQLAVSLSAAAAVPVAVEYYIGGGSATGGVDYVFAAGTLTFDIGETAKVLPLTITDDVFQEPADTVNVRLRNASGAALGTSSYTFTIQDNDTAPAPTVGFASAAATGSESISPAAIVVSLSAVQVADVTVDYAVTGGTAVNGTDYAITAGTLTFAPGETAKVIPNTVTDDSTTEPSETVTLALSNATGATLGPIVAHTYTIADNDGATVTIAATTPIAREALLVAGGFTLTRTGSPAAGLTVNLTVSGTATSGADFQAIAATAAFTAGQATRTIAVTPLADGLVEDDETVILTVVAGTGYNVGAASAATVTLLDFEPTVTLTAPDPSAAEAGLATGEFRLTRVGPTGEPLTVTLDFSGSATEGADYLSPTNPVTIPSGASFTNVSIVPLPDHIYEGTENIVATVAPVVGYVVGGTGAATVTLTDALMENWRLTKFGANAGDPAIAGDLADPDFDGICNLAEYAFGTDPFLVSAAWRTPAKEGADYTFIYQRATPATDVLFVFEELNASLEWVPATVTEQLLSVTSALRTYKVRTPAAGAPGKIIRIGVTRP